MEVQGAEHLPFGRSREVDQSNWEGCGRLKWQNAIWTPIDRFIAWSQGSKTSTREEKIIKFRDKPSWPMDSGCLAQVCVRHMFRHRFPLQPTGEHQTVSNVFISANGRIRGQHAAEGFVSKGSTDPYKWKRARTCPLDSLESHPVWSHPQERLLVKNTMVQIQTSMSVKRVDGYKINQIQAGGFGWFIPFIQPNC